MWQGEGGLPASQYRGHVNYHGHVKGSMSLPSGNLVQWRMDHGSLCNICPLNGQRKVGVDGPQDAAVVLIGEAPGREEEEYNSQHQQYGKPFVGRSGWALKARLLAPVSLCDTQVMEDGWIRPTQLRTFVMNVTMCRPPNNKIASPEGKRAVTCCSNSARALLAQLLHSQERVLVPLGGAALSLLTGLDVIAPYRGRVLTLEPERLHPRPESEIMKLALRGVKAPEEFKVHESFLKRVLTAQKKYLSLPLIGRRAMLEKQVLVLAKPYLKLLVMLHKPLRAKRSSSASVSPRPVRQSGRTPKLAPASLPVAEPCSSNESAKMI